MNDTNQSTIPSSYQPSNYRTARYASSLGDADLPLPTTDFLKPPADEE